MIRIREKNLTINHWPKVLAQWKGINILLFIIDEVEIQDNWNSWISNMFAGQIYCAIREYRIGGTVTIQEYTSNLLYRTTTWSTKAGGRNATSERRYKKKDLQEEEQKAICYLLQDFFFYSFFWIRTWLFTKIKSHQS